MSPLWHEAARSGMSAFAAELGGKADVPQTSLNRRSRPQAVFLPDRRVHHLRPTFQGDFRTFCVAPKIATTRFKDQRSSREIPAQAWDRLASSTRYRFASTAGPPMLRSQHSRRE